MDTLDVIERYNLIDGKVLELEVFIVLSHSFMLLHSSSKPSFTLKFSSLNTTFFSQSQHTKTMKTFLFILITFSFFPLHNHRIIIMVKITFTLCHTKCYLLYSMYPNINLKHSTLEDSIGGDTRYKLSTP